LLQYLEPTTEQQEQLEPIIRRYAQQMGEQWREHRQERKALVDAMHEEIKPLLTSDQLEKLNNFSKRFRSKRERKGSSRREKRSEPTGLEQ
jgi:hypothetical protein